MINMMELIQKEDEKKDRFYDENLRKPALQARLEARAEQYPTLSICEECVESCSQVEVTGLIRFYCGIKNREWRK